MFNPGKFTDDGLKVIASRVIKAFGTGASTEEIELFCPKSDRLDDETWRRLVDIIDAATVTVTW